MKTETTKVRTHIRWMIRDDLPKVLNIEELAFEFPWDEEGFIRVLRQRNAIGMAAEYNERIVGFFIYELHKTKLELLNFAVNPLWHRRGIGSQMMDKLISKLSVNRRTRIVANVSEKNLDGQLFFKAMGFRAVGVVDGAYAYRAGCDAAYRFVYRYSECEEW